jgi:PAS domain S-box-containing protein
MTSRMIVIGGSPTGDPELAAAVACDFPPSSTEWLNEASELGATPTDDPAAIVVVHRGGSATVDDTVRTVGEVRAARPVAPVVVVRAPDRSAAAEELMRSGADAILSELAGGRLREVIEASRRRIARERSDGLQERQEWERRYRVLFDAHPLPMWIFDLETHAFLAVNDAAVACYGYSREEFLAMRLEDMRPAEDLPALQQHLAAISPGGGYGPPSTWRHLTKGGSEITVSLSAHSLTFDGRPARIVTAVNITELRHAEDARQASEERYRRLVELSPDAIFVHADGRFVFANAATAELLGAREPAELVGRPILDVVAARDRAAVEARVRQMLESGLPAPTLEETLIRLDGEPVAVDVTAIPFEIGDRPGIQVVARNIEARVRADALERKRLMQLAAVNRVARQAASHLDEDALFSAVVHEIHVAFGFRTVALLVVVPEQGEVERRAVAGGGLGGAVPRFSQSVEAGLLGAAISSGAAVVSNDVLNDPRYRPDPNLDVGTRAEVCIPIVVGGGTAAILDVQETSVGAFDDVDVQMLETVADQVALAMSNARLFRRIQEELAQRARLSAAVEQAAESIVITDRDGAIVYVNPAFERLTGYARGEVIGENPRILKSGRHDEAFYRAMWETLDAGDPWSGTMVNRRKDGTFFEEEGVISPIRDASGMVVNYVAVRRDVTREHEVEEQFRRAQRMEAIGRLAGGIAHDFNNLLQAILASAQVLSMIDGRLERQQETAAEIVEHVQRGAALTRQLLLFARRGVSRREPVDLGSVVESAKGLLRRLLRENIAIDVRIGAEPIAVRLDRGQFDQVMMNLALNAADAMPDGGRLTLAAGRDADSAWFAVSDTGVGVPAELLDRLFEPFFTTKSAERGTGLGLAVVHGIVSQHGGHVSVQSAVGKGTTFRVELPLVEGDVLPVVRPDEAPGPASGRGERILIVEDNPAVRRVLSTLLTRVGYQVHAVGSGEAAGTLPLEPAFDVVLSDVMLPGASGLAVARSLRERWPELKVILMSGYAEDEILRREIDEGAVRFVQKPVDIETLAREVRAALEER